MAKDHVGWSRGIAALVLDRLVDEGILKRADFDAALEAAAEEIQIRLAMGDYPSSDENESPAP